MQEVRAPAQTTLGRGEEMVFHVHDSEILNHMSLHQQQVQDLRVMEIVLAVLKGREEFTEYI